MSTESLRDLLFRYLPNPKSRIKKLKDVKQQHQKNLSALRADNLLEVDYSVSSVNGLEWSSQKHHNAVSKIRKGSHTVGSPRTSLPQILSGNDPEYYSIKDSKLEEQVEKSLQAAIHQINLEIAVAYVSLFPLSVLAIILFMVIFVGLVIISTIASSTLTQATDIIIRSVLQIGFFQSIM